MNVFRTVFHPIQNAVRALPAYVARVKTYALAHKAISAVAAIVIIGAGWTLYAHLTNASGETRYVLGTAATGTVVSSVSASGQVSASDQLDVKPKVSGEIWWIGVKPGEVVRVGQALLSIDNTDAAASVRDAERSLAASELQFQKDSAEAPIDYQKTLDTLANDKEDLSTTYTDTYSTLSDNYLSLPAVMTGADDTLNGSEVIPNGVQANVDALVNILGEDDKPYLTAFGDKAKADYATARQKYDASVLAYKDLTRYSSTDDVEKLLTQSIDTDTAITQSLQSELNLLTSVTDRAQQKNKRIPSAVSTLETNARGFLSTANSNLSSLLSQKKTLDAAKQAITADEQNITLLQVGDTSGSNPISLQISKNNLEQQKENLAKLQQTLSEYTVTAPFGGTIAAVNAKVHDEASTGTAAFTLITDQKIAELSLNEVDAAKIKEGDKATLTFDAIDGLTLTGSVAQLDTIGTVSQGVVNYAVKIAFDTQDARVKPGMTVNAAIITDAHQNVLIVPSSAVKTQNGASYVQVFTPALPDTGSAQGVASPQAPSRVEVETGLSDDTNTEIVSGLTAGQQVVVRTITGTTAPAAASATSLLGGGTRTGGTVRVGGNATFTR